MTPEDRIAIADLVTRYADAVNVYDARAWGLTWDADGRWELGPDRTLMGRDAVVAFWRTAMASFETVIQVVCQGTADDDPAGRPDRAVGRWTLFEVNRRDGANGLVVGCYRDGYVRRGNGWCFAERRFTATYRGALPDGEFVAFPPLG